MSGREVENGVEALVSELRTRADVTGPMPDALLGVAANAIEHMDRFLSQIETRIDELRHMQEVVQGFRLALAWREAVNDENAGPAG